MSYHVKTFLTSLCYISKIFLLAPYKLMFNKQHKSQPIPLATTTNKITMGNVYTILCFLLYFTFHLYHQLSINMGKSTGNLVTTIIDIYNRYSNMLLYCALILCVLWHQAKILNILMLFVEIEELFYKQLNIRINNLNTLR